MGTYGDRSVSCAFDRNALVIPGDEFVYPVELRLTGFFCCSFNKNFVSFLLLPFPIS